MTLRCFVCLGELSEGSASNAHARCARRVFGTDDVPMADVDPRRLVEAVRGVAGRQSMSGVQRKVSATLDKAALRIGTGGAQYILKPWSPTYEDLPQNEHVTMLAAAAVGIETASHGLALAGDGSQALAIRRFDRAPDGRKLPMEDLCQLGEVLEKYKGSMEQCAHLVARYSTQSRLDLRRLFQLQLFSWWVGNNDLHRKNIALYDPGGGHRSTPAYDLVNTWILGFDEPETALQVGGRDRRIGPPEWRSLAQACSLEPESVLDLVGGMLARGGAIAGLVQRSFLLPEARDRYLRVVADRGEGLRKLQVDAKQGSTRAAVRRREPWTLDSTTVRALLRWSEEGLRRARNGLLADGGLGPDSAASARLGAEPREPRAQTALVRLLRAASAVRRSRRIDRLHDALEKLAVLASGAEYADNFWNRIGSVEVAAAVDLDGWRVGFERGQPWVVAIERPNHSDIVLGSTRIVRGGVGPADRVDPSARALASHAGARVLVFDLGPFAADEPIDVAAWRCAIEEMLSAPIPPVTGAVLRTETVRTRESRGGDSLLVREGTTEAFGPANGDVPRDVALVRDLLELDRVRPIP